MTTRGGHIASIMIATIFATLLIASFLPSSLDKESTRAALEHKSFAELIRQKLNSKPEVAQTVDSAAAVARTKEQQLKTQQLKAREEGKTMDKSVFFDIRLTDLVMIVVMGLVWWNSRKILTQIRSFERDPLEAPQAPAVPSEEIEKLNRAAAAMEALAQVMIVSGGKTTATTTVGKKKPGRKTNAERAVAAAEAEARAVGEKN